jgi:hypothetical protein
VADLCADYDLTPEQVRAAVRVRSLLAEQGTVRASAG